LAPIAYAVNSSLRSQLSLSSYMLQSSRGLDPGKL
jgi:hypothetical protein